MSLDDTALRDLAAGKYLLLTTFRRDGRAVPTPVWVMRDGDALAVWSAADSGKVKRIRNSGKVTVGPCDLRGKPLGSSVPAFAELVDPAVTRRYTDLMKRKYGLMGRLTLAGSLLRGGRGRTVGIRITPDAPRRP